MKLNIDDFPFLAKKLLTKRFFAISKAHFAISG